MDFQASQSQMTEGSIRSPEKDEFRRHRVTVPKDAQESLELTCCIGKRRVLMNIASYSALRSIWKTRESPVADVNGVIDTPDNEQERGKGPEQATWTDDKLADPERISSCRVVVDTTKLHARADALAPPEHLDEHPRFASKSTIRFIVEEIPDVSDGARQSSPHLERYVCSARQYKISHTSRGWLSGAWGALFALGETDTGRYLSDTHLTWHKESVLSPLATSLLCAAGYIASITFLYRSNSYHRYQDHWLIFGVLVAWAVGLPLGMSFQDTILKVLPWTVIGSLLGSGVLHAALANHNQGPRACEKDPFEACSSAEKFENARSTW